MSRWSTLDIGLGDEVGSVSIVNILLEKGWTLFNDDKVSYLPLGDDDDFNWQTSNISQCDVLALLGKKEELKENIGIVLFWKDSGVGGELLIHDSRTISFNLSIRRRKETALHDFTDIHWYLERTVPFFISNGISIESLTWEEHV